MRTMEIDGRGVGIGRPTFIIAEIGVNHDGSVARAIELVNAAATCGADAVKLQLFRADALMHGTAAFASYQSDRCAARHPIDMLRQYELGYEELRVVVDAIRSAGLVPIATPFSPDDVAMIERFALPAIKIASPDLVNRPLLRRAFLTGLPMLVSTGAATFEEVRTFSAWMNDRSIPYALLHCISSYPVPMDQANLSWIGELARSLDVPVGYSDHTAEMLAGACAVSHGAVVIEKHLTHDRNAPGPDHAASFDPEQFGQYVRWIRQAECLAGSGAKRVLEIERDVRRVSRQSLVLKREVSAGRALEWDDLTVQRPGTGIPAARIDDAVGRRAARDLPAGVMLAWDMLADAA